jgi:hypothetical protein
MIKLIRMRRVGHVARMEENCEKNSCCKARRIVTTRRFRLRWEEILKTLQMVYSLEYTKVLKVFLCYTLPNDISLIVEERKRTAIFTKVTFHLLSLFFSYNHTLTIWICESDTFTEECARRNQRNEIINNLECSMIHFFLQNSVLLALPWQHTNSIHYAG